MCAKFLFFIYYLGILGNVCVLSKICLGLESVLLCFLFGHDKTSGSTVGQIGGVGSGHGSVGFNKGRFQFSHLRLCGYSDTVILGDKILALGNLNKEKFIFVFFIIKLFAHLYIYLTPGKVYGCSKKYKINVKRFMIVVKF